MNATKAKELWKTAMKERMFHDVTFDFAAHSHNVPGSLHDNPGKLDRCVKEVTKKGKVDNAYAVCTAAMKRKSRKDD